VNDPPRTFNEAEAARRLGVSKATLTRERAAGRIHPYCIGQRVIRYTDEILGEYLETCRVAPRVPAVRALTKRLDTNVGRRRSETPMLSREDGHLLARATFKMPKGPKKGSP
jgi:Helix-turn-helix domain